MENKNNQEESIILLKKYGTKWAVLVAMEVDLYKKGEKISKEILSEIESAKVKISSGCFSTCEVHCVLNQIEGSLVSIGSKYGDDYMNTWFDLFEKTMSSKLSYDHIKDIPVLNPVQSECGFLKCTCEQN